MAWGGGNLNKKKRRRSASISFSVFPVEQYLGEAAKEACLVSIDAEDIPQVCRPLHRLYKRRLVLDEAIKQGDDALRLPDATFGGVVFFGSKRLALGHDSS
jgi:hypothetical protein